MLTLVTIVFGEYPATVTLTEMSEDTGKGGLYVLRTPEHTYQHSQLWKAKEKLHDLIDEYLE